MENEEVRLYIIGAANKELMDLLTSNGYLITSGGNAFVVGNVEYGSGAVGNTAMVQIQNLVISKRITASIPGTE
jgi:hypothetical protein